jgi:hypothetical protein
MLYCSHELRRAAMLHSLMMFLAPATAQSQATFNSPPDFASPRRLRQVRGAISWKFALNVLANAIGFLALLASCWGGLRLMEALLRF